MRNAWYTRPKREEMEEMGSKGKKIKAIKTPNKRPETSQRKERLRGKLK